MFDPLDLYTPVKDNSIENDRIAITEISLTGGGKSSAGDGNRHDDDNIKGDTDDSVFDDLPIDVLDLPLPRYASQNEILCVLLLLQPDDQINFSSVSFDDANLSVSVLCKQQGIPPSILNSLLDYYKRWNNIRLDSHVKICAKIPHLRHKSRESLLNYYTSVLKYYQECSEENFLKDQIIKEVSLRISENCGRSARPALCRKFSFEGLGKLIEIFEPSLTADNLGWKTWGSSFILSQKLINTMAIPDVKSTLKVLELGSGTGLAGISWLAKWSEKNETTELDMFLTDLPEIVPNLQKNLSANGLAHMATATVLDWTDTRGFEKKYGSGEFDIIIVSDPIYSPNHPKLLVDMLIKFLDVKGKCYLQIPVRDKYAKERAALWELLEINGFKVINQTLDQGMEDWGLVNYLYQEIEKETHSG